MSGVADYKDKSYKSAEKNLVMSGKKGAIFIGNLCKNIFSADSAKAKEAAALILAHAVIG